jgi:hypothetical protein
MLDIQQKCVSEDLQIPQTEAVKNLEQAQAYHAFIKIGEENEDGSRPFGLPPPFVCFSHSLRSPIRLT